MNDQFWCGGAFICGGGNFCGVLGFFYAVYTPLTQQAVNFNEWSLIIAPLDPVSLYRKENQKTGFWGLWAPLFLSFYWEEVVGTVWGGVSFWHTMILLLLFVASSTWCWHWWSHWVECLDQAALHSMWCALIKLKPGPDRWGPSMLNFQLACWQIERELVHIHSMSTRSSNSSYFPWVISTHWHEECQISDIFTIFSSKIRKVFG